MGGRDSNFLVKTFFLETSGLGGYLSTPETDVLSKIKEQTNENLINYFYILDF